MQKLKKYSLRFILISLCCFSFFALYLYFNLRASLPRNEGTIQLPVLQQSVTITLDDHGIPTVSASTELDAYKALGYLTARERLFQMDVIRRKSAGRLSEIFGNAALEIDIQQRLLQLEPAAKAIAKNLPDDQLSALQAYVAGINTAMEQMSTLPFEFLMLRYQPEPWRIEDSLLVALSMFQVLSSEQETERMLTVMEHALPAQVTDFLTPDVDEYESVLTGGSGSWRPKQQIPVQALAAILNTQQSLVENTNRKQESQNPWVAQFMSSYDDDLAPGSNAWAVAGSKTSDGRAILANDMHLALRVPNIWYRATLRFSETMISGVTLPGLPLVIAGTNNHVAWGYTNAYVDLVDLVKLEVNPENPDQYSTVDGWENFKHRKEQIHIKDAEHATLDVLKTRWGPVSARKLLGYPVALKWTALDPQAVNLGLIKMHKAKTLEQAVTTMNNAGGPPQNAMLVDQSGRIAWTLMGKIPNRYGFDGAVSQSWATADIGWNGYMNATLLPRVIDPGKGYLTTANNRTIGSDYPYKLGHDFQMSFRAWRINERLEHMQSITEKDMLDLQLDTSTEFYRFYQNLALSVLTPSAVSNHPFRQALRNSIVSWDGNAEPESTGFPILFEFRKALALEIIPAYYRSCLHVQKDFKYVWSKKETPIRQLLDAKISDTLPHQHKYENWNALILSVLEASTRKLMLKHQINNPSSLIDLTWGQVNKTTINHPFSMSFPMLSRMLDMPESSLPGCPYCVRVSYGLFGASERMAVSPGHLQNAIMHMPTGQSGHPLSKHYNDQQQFWQQGKPLAFLSNKVAHQFQLVPGND